jgi:NitT/TauT family transport system permease protein
MTSQITFGEVSSHAARPDGQKSAVWKVSGMTAFIHRHLAIITAIGLVASWQLVCGLFDVPTYILPSPLQILKGYGEQPFGSWAGHAWTTLRVALSGFVVAVIVSVPLAMFLVSSETFSRAVFPILVAVHSIPIVAIAPIIIVILGADDLPRIAITFLISFFPIVVTTTAGLGATPSELIELSRSLRAEPRRCMIDIRLPYALPYIFSALKISVTLSLVGAVVAEFVAAERGLGYFIQFSTVYFKLHQAFGALIILVALNITLFKSVDLAQRLFAPWSIPRKDE